jgi:mannose-6-phosphate isomerase-like protein (cupin superfamily)
MPFSTADLLDALELNGLTGDERPWGTMLCLHAPADDVTIKHIIVKENGRTSLQYHERKEELLVIIAGWGFVEVGDAVHYVGCIRIKPGQRHRVVGPLEYLEVSTYDDDTDTVRVEDDYGRAT